MLGDDVGKDAAAHVELCSEPHEARFGGRDQVVQYAVGDIFVKMSFFAERPHVKFEAFQFDALFIGDVIQDQCGEIRLSGLRAQAGELGNLHVDVVITARIRVREGFQRFCRSGRHLVRWHAWVKIAHYIAATAKLRLSHIKLAGFKSFVDPTHIHLPGQIVGVVGPNGCGKSNVIDALRWVLGESKASALRGESMQDVIFNGSGKRKPVARASVELVFDNSLGQAGGQWSSYAEISIGRMLQRNGDSSYLINNQKVRRKDITDIFLGTGLGARAYAIIEQGMISRIIEAKPEELRVFLEEAAGVSKYRDRRRETSQRLLDTRDNLQRVDDILLEMDSQLVRLGQQAEVALQYRQLEVQRNTMQHLLWLVKKQDADTQRAGFARELENTRTGVEAQTAQLRELESRLEIERSSHYQLSDTVHDRQGELYSANAEIATLEQQIKQAAMQQQRLQQQIASAELQIGQQQQQRHQAANQLEEWQHKQEEAAEKLIEAQMLVQMTDEHLPEAEEAAKNAQENCNRLQREQSQQLSQMQLTDTQHANLQRNIAQMQARHQRLKLELEQLALPDLVALNEAQEELVMLEMEQGAVQESLAGLHEQLPQADALLRDHRASLQQQERLIVQLDARLHALQKLQGALDNDKKLHDWLLRHQLEKLPRLWQSIRIASGWENALEAVLRERLNALAMPNLKAFDDAPPARLALFESAADAVCPASVAGAARTDIFQLTPLRGYVECQDEQVLPAIGEWLALIFTVENVRAGLAHRELLPAGAFFVTPEGHLIGLHSVLFHAPDGQLHGVLSRQREIEALESELGEHNQMVVQFRLQVDEAEGHHKTIDAQIPPLRSRVNELQQRRHALQMQILKLDQIRERTEERRSQLGREIAEVIESLGCAKRSHFASCR
jgi:chromosome segregation protein